MSGGAMSTHAQRTVGEEKINTNESWILIKIMSSSLITGHVDPSV